jgi:pyruvate/2-oxoglutarate dehydrogenase complex dihydrolipoamide dehydrogenase (E3) component
MISEFTQAIAAELTLEDMHRIIRPHPTFEEIITQAVCQ